MQIIRECRMRAAILTAIAKEAPELEDQLLYVAEKWLTLGHFKGATQRQCGSGGLQVTCYLHSIRRLASCKWLAP
jgi:hypothetical protein